MPSTNLSNLLPVARAKGKATASGGKWWAERGDDGDVIVGHYSTHLFTVEGDGETVPINGGWGSVSDKAGVGKVLRSAECWTSHTSGRIYHYHQLFV